jgi:hypothetical protein
MDMKEGKYIVRIYDGFDNEWFDICSPCSYDEALKLYNEKTENNTMNNTFMYIDYFGVFKW